MGGMKSLLLAALLVCTPGVAIAQQTAPTTPAAATTEVKAPELSETLELKRQNLVLRSNLLNTQIENARAQADRENAAIGAALTTLRADVEKAYPGWTIGDSGAVTQKAEADTKTPNAKPSITKP